MSASPKITTVYDVDASRFHSETLRAEAAARRYGRTAKSSVVAANDAVNRSFRGAAQGVAAIDGPLGGVSSRITAVNGLLTSGNLKWAALGATIAAVAAGLVMAVKEFAAVERQQLKTIALLKATGDAAGKTAGQLDQQARAIALGTLASTEGIRQAQQVMLTFKSVTGQTFDRTIVLAQDLAAVMGGDARSAALQLGKALEDPVRGLNSLRRSGVSFTESEKDLIATLQKSGDLLEAQEYILDKLSDQIGGAGEAEAGGVSGKVDTLSQRWGEFLEALNASTGASGVAAASLDAISVGLDKVARGMNPSDLDLARKKLNDLHHEYGELGEKIRRLEEAPVAFNRAERIAVLQEIRDSKQAEMKVIQEAEIERQKRESELANEARRKSEKAAKEQADAVAAKAAAKEAEKEEVRLERVKRENERVVSLQKAKFDRIHEAALLAQEKTEELENYRYEREKEQLNADMERLRERQILTKEIEDEFLEAKREAAISHEAKLEEIRKEARDKEVAEKDATYSSMLGLAEKYNQAREGGENRWMSVALGVGRILLNSEKRNALKKATMKGFEAIQTAWASAPFPFNVPSVAITTAETAANISGIAGIAHGGLTNVPKESTYWLDKGERVISPRQNRDLTNFMESGGGGVSQINLTVVNELGSADVDIEQDGENIRMHLKRFKEELDAEVQGVSGIGRTIQRTFKLSAVGAH
ncbi:MAG: phage tail length tape measure family protein [Cellvibrionaceae bacterium]